MHAQRLVVGLVAAATTLSLAGSGHAAAPDSAKPGPNGPVITLARHLSLTGHTTDIVTTSNGTAYVAWLGSLPEGERTVYLCVLPLGAHACKGGVQSTPSAADSVAASTAVDLNFLVVNGTPTLLWLHSTADAAKIATATVSPAGVLSAETDIADGPRNGDLLDAGLSPSGQVWTITYAGVPEKHIEVHEGVTAAGKTIKTAWPVGYASLAFAHSTPVIVATSYGAIGTPPAYSSGKSSGFTAMKPVKHTWAVGTNVGLTTTSSGLRLSTEIGNASYSPVVAKWDGHGFSKPESNGDKNPCAPNSHDTSTDKSGRMVDATDECGQITVDNLANTTRASIYRFKAGGTPAGDQVQVASTPRGHAWVLWGVEDSAAGGSGDKLMVRPLLLPGLHARKSAHGKAGKITVTGPATCLPADSISIGVSANPAHGWKVGSKKLTLGGQNVGGAINGAALTPGKKYTLKGSVTFIGGGHSTVTASLSFKACPKP